jgi:UDP-N-acetylmuramate dehydrogenase
MIYKQIDFSKYSSFKIGGVFDVLLLDDTQHIKNHYLIGSCNNTLIGENPPPLMMLDKKI